MPRNIFRRWLRRHHLSPGRLTSVKYYPEHSDLPDVPRANELAIAGTLERPKWALMDCPCGRGHTVLLPLSMSEGLHWNVTFDAAGFPSINPSIDRNRDEGIRCHFWIRDGNIIWA